jgi:bifunctional non-homologous end joining protein LigD
MALALYKKKRNFSETPEPQGGKPGKKELRFVIQKHAASHLHYDFRLEMDGVLKSWAVPKGPSTDPTVKRLAMMVEDHPYDYRNFEGIIPSGYGAGTVIIWDEGTYEPAGETGGSKKEWDKLRRQGIHKGKIHFILHGKKLKGEFALIKPHGKQENAWLLFKVRDKYVSEKDISLKNKSVVSGKTLEQVQKTSDNFWESHKPSKVAVKKTAKKTAAKKSAVKRSPAKEMAAKKTVAKKKGVEKKIPANQKLAELLQTKGIKKAVMPGKYHPMLATLVDKPFDSEGWIYEVKWDGYRALAFMNKGTIDLRSRNDKSFNDKFYPVVKALAEWNINAVVDGEVVVSNENGISDFGALQNWRREADGDLLFYVFDILWYEGRDLTALPLTTRREILKNIIKSGSIIRMSDNFGEKASEFFKVAQDLGLEGIIAKKADSEYHPGSRSKEWLKIKANKRQEVVIAGYTVNDDTSKPFSALLAGVYQDGRLHYTGKIGTGFDIKTQKEMLKEFSKIRTDKIPFTEVPDVNKPSRFRPDPPHAEVYWLKPKLVCEVSYTELTTEGIMRHPSFQGMRIDKDPKDIVLEKEKSVKKIVKQVQKKTPGMLKPAPKQEEKTLLNPHEETQVKKIKGHELKFTNLSKIFWPAEKITKRDLINYYYNVAPFILPYLKNRPQSLNRHPNGINGKSFYQKDVTGKAPNWIKTFLYHSEGDNRDKHFMVCTDEASLLYMATLGCIELNPWHSRIQSPDKPDWCIIDLDPAKNNFDKVIEAALVTRDILESLGIPSFPKTSGSTGMHIYIPLGAKYTFEQSKEFARVIVTMVHNEIPRFTSIERVVKNRGGKMYLDFLQNRDQATIAAPYSARPKPGATVSMPLHWHEVKKGLKMKDFHIFNAMERLKSEGDIFKPVLGKGIDLKKIIKNFE